MSPRQVGRKITEPKASPRQHIHPRMTCKMVITPSRCTGQCAEKGNDSGKNSWSTSRLTNREATRERVHRWDLQARQLTDAGGRRDCKGGGAPLRRGKTRTTAAHGKTNVVELWSTEWTQPTTASLWSSALKNGGAQDVEHELDIHSCNQGRTSLGDSMIS